MSITLSNRSKEAFALALDLHKDQKRKIAKGESEDLAIPYITHLLNVASNVLQAGGNEDQFIAALLHDSVEDQPNTLGRPTTEIIEEKFGKRVLELVLAATDGEPNQKRTQATWKDRKENFIAKLEAKSIDDGELKTTGTAISELLPPLDLFDERNTRGTHKEKVIDKLKAFFDRFSIL